MWLRINQSPLTALPICLQTTADISRTHDIRREIVLHLRGRKVWETTHLDPSTLRRFIFLWRGNFLSNDRVSQSSVTPQNLPLNIKDRELDFLIDTGVIFSTIHLENQSLPVTSDSIQAVGISGQSISLPISEPTPISLGSLNTHHAFLIQLTSKSPWQRFIM